MDLTGLTYQARYGEREGVSWVVERVQSVIRYLVAMVVPAPRPKAWRIMHRRAVLSPPPKYRKKLRMPKR